MPIIARQNSELLLIDFQDRLMPAIANGPDSSINAARLLAAARRLGVRRLFTEQNPARLGPTVSALMPEPGDLETVLPKMTFDALGDPVIAGAVQAGAAVIVAGWEAHVCVLQTVAGLMARGQRVHVVADAIGSRTPANHQAALDRMRVMGADIVTTEMVVFEWLGTAADAAFREIVALVK